MFDDIKYWWRIWRKTDLFFQNWDEEFNKFSPQNVEESKNGNFDGVVLFEVKSIWA